MTQIREYTPQEIQAFESICLSATPPSEMLTVSVERLGLLAPFEIITAGDFSFISDGHKRLQIIAGSSSAAIPCVVIACGSIQEAFIHAWSRRFFNNPPCAVAKALAWKKCSEHGVSVKHPEIRQALRFSLKQTEITLLETIAGLPDDCLRYLQENEAGTKQIQAIMRIGAETFAAIIRNIAIPLKLNANQIRKCLAYCADILAAGAHAKELKSMLQTIQPGESIREKTDLLMQKLHELRYPNFSKHEASFMEMADGLFGHSITVNHRMFEGKTLEFSFSAASSEEAAKKAADLIETKPALDGLFAYLDN